MLKTLFSFFASLKLTFVLLCAATVLVFVGTLAQVDLGLYNAQNQFFRSLVVYWGPKDAGWRIPVFPGGYLIGTLLLVNLIVAHLRYYKAGRKKLGIALIHTGIVLLLLGQFMTDFLQVESHMRLSEGQSKSYSENSRENELAVMDTTDPAMNQVVALSESLLSARREIQLPSMPLTVRVKEYYANALPAFLTATDTNSIPVQGVGRQLKFRREPPVTRMEARDIPAALVELVSGSTSLGHWWVSNWLTEEPLVSSITRQASIELRKLLAEPQGFPYAGRSYELAMRPERYYKPFALELLQFKHDKYPGTDIPKNFSSRVRILNPKTEENREVLIYMNNPLRYAGETYYQSGFDENDPRVTILQVVRNPGWLTPYLACVLVSLGMGIQFLMHLWGFVGKWKTA
jgi:hypothetical protein